MRIRSMGTKVVRWTVFLFHYLSASSRTVNGLSLPLSVSIKSYSERCFSSSLTGSSNVSEKEKKRSMFLSFSMHSTGCQSVNESTANFFHLFLFCDWLNRVPNTLLTSSVFMFLPDNSVSPLTFICFKSLLSKQVTWSTFFCLSRSCSLEQTPAQHPACVFHSLFQNCSKISTLLSTKCVTIYFVPKVRIV